MERIADKTTKQLMIDAQIADRELQQRLHTASESELEGLYKELELAEKRVRRRLASIKTGRVRWYDGKTGYVRPHGLEWYSAEVVAMYDNRALDKNQGVEIELEYIGSFSPIMAVIKKAV